MNRTERPHAEWVLTTGAATLGVVHHGVRFQVTARARELAHGWQAEVKVVATSADGLPHGLEDSPIRFGGSLTSCRQGACSAGGFGEGRSRCGGNRFPLEVNASHLELFIRRHPLPGARLLERGDRLTLRVGIFGMARLDGTLASPELAVVRLEIPEQGPARVGVRPAPSRR